MQQLEITLDASEQLEEGRLQSQKQKQLNETPLNDGDTKEERQRKAHREYHNRYMREWNKKLSKEKRDGINQKHKLYIANATPDQRERWKLGVKRWKLKMQKENPERLKAYYRGHYRRHRESMLAKSKARHKKNDHRFRKYLKDSYGLTLEAYNQMLKNNPLCAICGKRFELIPKPHIDHDHATGVVRGVLCSGCNTGIGVLEKSNGQWLKKALEYIAKTNELFRKFIPMLFATPK